MPVKQKEKPARAAKTGNNTVFVCEIKPDAKEVFLVGEFNDWNPRADRMVKRQGAFRKAKKLTPGQYQYKFLVDGEWHHDPAANDQIPNQFGTMNSVICVSGSSKK
jgi:1,4-alpha-glucan branching enzyme